MPDYASALYWQERYAHDPSASFDWYCTLEELATTLTPLLQQLHRRTHTEAGDLEILVPGCGNSTLSARLYAQGFKNVSSIDISSVVVSQLRDRYARFPEMDFSVLDATDMKKDLPDDCFDAIVDKALLDCVLCGDDAFRRVIAMVGEMHRVLKPGGLYAVLSHGAPASRLGYFTAAGLTWEPRVVEVPKPRLEDFKDATPSGSDVYYLYLCTKPETATS